MGSQKKRGMVLALAKKLGILRPKDVLKYGITKMHLWRLQEEGVLERPARGLYVLSGTDFGANEYLIQACKRVPKGVICLLSALRFHEITTQSPFALWMAIPNKARTPRIEDLPLRFVRFSGKAFDKGIETHFVKGASMKVYCIAKTVADCFKYRNKLGLDVAIEALQECWRAKKCSIDELWKYAKICRISNIMKPYMEMLR